MNQLQSILTDFENETITKHQAYDLIVTLYNELSNDKLKSAKMYGRNLSQFLLSDQIDLLAKELEIK
jgi:hypothetical protein